MGMKIFHLTQINQNYYLDLMRKVVKRGYIFWNKYIGDDYKVVMRFGDFVLAKKF